MLRDIVNNFYKMPDKSLNSFLEISSQMNISKGEYLVQCNEIPKDFYIIKKGVVRAFYLNESGKEFTRSFVIENQPVASLLSLIFNKPSELYYECLTDCVMYRVNFKEFMKLTKTDIHVSNLYSRVLEYAFRNFGSKIHDLSMLNSTNRYLKLRQKIPRIESLVSQYHIASYLNITPVQLSRIRKKLSILLT